MSGHVRQRSPGSWELRYSFGTDPAGKRKHKRRGHGEGSIDPRGENRWRLRWRVDGVRYNKAFSGSITEARAELRRLLKSADDGQHVAPAKITVEQYVTDWLGTDSSLSPKSRERYQQLAKHQVIPHLGSVPLQRLNPRQIDAWHHTLLKSGLSTTTVGNAHRMLHRGLERAVRLEILSRNVAHGIKPPRSEKASMRRRFGSSGLWRRRTPDCG
jgi:integrase